MYDQMQFESLKYNFNRESIFEFNLGSYKY